MFDHVLWLSRWIVGVNVAAVLSLWLLAVLLAGAGFRATAEALNSLFLEVIPYAGILVVALVVAILARWFTRPSSHQH
jgi:hypothetical protein